MVEHIELNSYWDEQSMSTYRWQAVTSYFWSAGGCGGSVADRFNFERDNDAFYPKEKQRWVLPLKSNAPQFPLDTATPRKKAHQVEGGGIRNFITSGGRKTAAELVGIAIQIIWPCRKLGSILRGVTIMRTANAPGDGKYAHEDVLL
jgi:hypothetical protein